MCPSQPRTGFVGSYFARFWENFLGQYISAFSDWTCSQRGNIQQLNVHKHFLHHSIILILSNYYGGLDKTIPWQPQIHGQQLYEYIRSFQINSGKKFFV